MDPSAGTVVLRGPHGNNLVLAFIQSGNEYTLVPNTNGSLEKCTRERTFTIANTSSALAHQADSYVPVSETQHEPPTRGPRTEKTGNIQRPPVFSSNYNVQSLRKRSQDSQVIRENIKNIDNCVPDVKAPYLDHVSKMQERYDIIAYNLNPSEEKQNSQRVFNDVTTSTSPWIDPVMRSVSVTMSSTRTSFAVPAHPPEPNISESKLHPRTNLQSIRKIKSETEFRISKKQMQNQMLKWLEEIFANNDMTGRQDVFQKLNAKLRKLAVIRNIDEEEKVYEKRVRFSSMQECVKRNHFSPCQMKYFRFCTQVYRAELSYGIFEDNEHKAEIADWINGIPLKEHNFMNKPVKKEQLFLFISNNLKSLALRTNFDETKIRTGILEMLEDIPIDIQGIPNKKAYLYSLAANLLDRLKQIDLRKSRKKWLSCGNTTVNNITGKTTKLTDAELKIFVDSELQNLLCQANVKISAEKLREITAELLNVVSDALKTPYTTSADTEKIIATLLLRTTDRISCRQADYFANIITRHVKEYLQSTTETQAWNKTHDTYMMHGQCNNRTNQCHASTSDNDNIQNEQNCHSPNNDREECSRAGFGISQQETKSNINGYLNHLSYEINQWLNTIDMHLPQAYDPNFRRLVVEDLAGDIIDRHMYRQLSLSSRYNDRTELEHLRYQIFKWVNKLAGENNTVTLERAPELLQRIRRIPVPIFTKRHSPTNIRASEAYSNRILSERKSCSSLGFLPQPVQLAVNVNQIDVNEKNKAKKENQERRMSAPVGQQKNNQERNMSAPAGIGQPMSSEEAAVGTSRAAPAAGPHQRIKNKGDSQDYNNSLVGMNATQLSEHFEQFVKDWVEKIPINAREDEAKKIREGLLSGVWKSLVKVKSVPGIVANSFYYQDVLDDELDELLSLLPTNPELEQKKQSLKSELIKKANAVNQQVKRRFAPKTFKQQLIINIDQQISRRVVIDDFDDTAQRFEELQVLCLVEEYILYACSRNEDPVKANVYRNKLLKRIRELVDELKRSHGQELKDIDKEAYMNEMLLALQQVPLPSEDTIREEADEILLGMEIDNWFENLPIAQNNNAEELMKRRRLRERLTRKIHDLQNSLNNMADSNAERVIRHEISSFLYQVPLERDEDLNINIMVDELTNRMKNRPRGFMTQQQRRKSVEFTDALQYDDFSKDLNFHSSFIEGGSCDVRCPIQQQKAQMSMLQQMSMMQPNQMSIQPNQIIMQPNQMSMLQQRQMQNSAFNQPVGSRGNQTFSPVGGNYSMQNNGRAYTSAPGQCSVSCAKDQNQVNQSMRMSRSYRSEDLAEAASRQAANMSGQAGNPNLTMSMFDPSIANSMQGLMGPQVHGSSGGAYFPPPTSMQPAQAPFSLQGVPFQIAPSTSSEWNDASLDIRPGAMTDVVIDPMGYHTFDHERPLSSSVIAGGYPEVARPSDDFTLTSHELMANLPPSQPMPQELMSYSGQEHMLQKRMPTSSSQEQMLQMQMPPPSSPGRIRQLQMSSGAFHSIPNSNPDTSQHTKSYNASAASSNRRRSLNPGKCPYQDQQRSRSPSTSASPEKKCSDNCPRKQKLRNEASLRNDTSSKSGRSGTARSLQAGKPPRQSIPMITDPKVQQNKSVQDNLPKCCRYRSQAAGGKDSVPECCKPRMMGSEVSGNRSGFSGGSGSNIVPNPRDENLTMSDISGVNQAVSRGYINQERRKSPVRYPGKEGEFNFNETPSGVNRNQDGRQSRKQYQGAEDVRGGMGAVRPMGGISREGSPSGGGLGSGGPGGGGPERGAGPHSGGGPKRGGGPKGGGFGRGSEDKRSGQENEFERYRCKCIEQLKELGNKPCYPGEGLDRGIPFMPCFCPYFM